MNLSALCLLVAVILALVASVQPSAGPLRLLPLALASFALSFLV